MRQDILHSGRMKPRHRGMLEATAPMKKAQATLVGVALDFGVKAFTC